MNHDTYMRNLKYDADVLLYKTETHFTDLEKRLVVAKGEGKDGLGVWD